MSKLAETGMLDSKEHRSSKNDVSVFRNWELSIAGTSLGRRTWGWGMGGTAALNAKQSRVTT